MNNRFDEIAQTGTPAEREVDLVDQLPAKLLDPRHETRGPYSGQLGSRLTPRCDVVMFLLPKSWTYTPIAMEHMTRLDVYKQNEPKQDVLKILMPRRGWRHELISMEHMTRLEIYMDSV